MSGGERRWWQRWFAVRPADPGIAPEIAQARALIEAIDAGGVPLNPARVNHIARNLGLEVSTRAPLAETIARIRAALQRDAAGPCIDRTD